MAQEILAAKALDEGKDGEARAKYQALALALDAHGLTSALVDTLPNGVVVAMLPNVKGLKGPLSCLNEARFGIADSAASAGGKATSTNHMITVRQTKPTTWAK